jgi:hypothetical protein
MATQQQQFDQALAGLTPQERETYLSKNSGVNPYSGNTYTGGGQVLGAATSASQNVFNDSSSPYNTGYFPDGTPVRNYHQVDTFYGAPYKGKTATYLSPDQIQQNSLDALIAGTTPNMPVNLPYQAPTVAGLGDLSGTLAGQETYLTKLEEERLRQEKAKADLKAQEDSQKKPWLDFIANKKSDAEVFDTALAKTGQNQAEYFAQQKAAIDELGALNQQYNDRVAKRDEQIAAAQDIIGTTGAISAKQAKIERLAAPELNRMSANINAKAAVMQAKQGLFAEASKYAQLYVDSQTAQVRDAYNAIKLIGEENAPLFDALDTKIKNAYNLQVDLFKRQVDIQTDEANKKITLITDAAKNGVDLSAYGNRSLEDVTAAYAQMVGAIPQTTGSTVGSAESGYQNIIRDKSGNIVSTQNITSGTGGGNSGGITNTQINDGATKAGVDINTFKTLPTDVQVFFSQSKDVTAQEPILKAQEVERGKISLTDFNKWIDSKTYSPAVKSFFKSQAQEASQNAPAEKVKRAGGNWNPLNWFGL